MDATTQQKVEFSEQAWDSELHKSRSDPGTLGQSGPEATNSTGVGLSQLSLWVQSSIWDLQGSRQKPESSAGPGMSLGPLREKIRARDLNINGLNSSVKRNRLTDWI